MQINFKFFIICMAILFGVICIFAGQNKHLKHVNTNLSDSLTILHARPPVVVPVVIDSTKFPPPKIVWKTRVVHDTLLGTKDSVVVTYPDTSQDSCHTELYAHAQDPETGIIAQAHIRCPYGDSSSIAFDHSKYRKPKINYGPKLTFETGGGFIHKQPFVLAGLGSGRYGFYLTSDGTHFGGMATFRFRIF